MTTEIDNEAPTKARLCSTQVWHLNVLVIVVIFTLCSSCNETARPKRLTLDPFSTAPLHTSYDIEVTFTDSSFTKATLRAGRAVVDEVRMETLLGGGVYVVFYNHVTHDSSAWLRSDSACIDDKTKNMTAIGNVLVQSDSSRTTLRTPSLVWLQKEERIRTSEVVKITTPTEVIDGVGLVSDQYLTDYKIFNVRGIHRQ